MCTGFTLAALLRLVDNVVNLLEGFNDYDSVSSVSVFSRLYEPCVSSLRLESVLYLIVRIVLLVFLFLLDFFFSLVVLN